VTEFEDILTRAAANLKARRPFVMYAKPGASHLAALFQTDNKEYGCDGFEKEGFAFADFAGKKRLLIPADAADAAMADISPLSAAASRKAGKSWWKTFLGNIRRRSARQHFEALAIGAIKAIRDGKYSKLVVSRKERIDVPGLDWKRTFSDLLQHYPDAFRYAFYHPGSGFWMGASPERLLKVSDGNFATVALAGTQLYHGKTDVDWGEKERTEQLFVTDYIIAELRGKISAIDVSPSYTVRAGNLLHLKTDITGRLNEKAGLAGILEALHPTPAVCGLPKRESYEYLLNHEGYDREFYSGFFGEVGHGENEFFVNLRCMKLSRNCAEVFVGCGITRDSNPILEYAETANKTMTMKNILHPKPDS
jgi:isochorismate synthase